MNISQQRKRSQGFSIILAAFTILYAFGVIYLFLGWIGVQSYDPETWRPDSLPFYIAVFVLALISLSAVWRWKKWGVYWLAAAWAINGVLNSIFVVTAPSPARYSFLAGTLVLAFFLLLLPVWKDME